MFVPDREGDILAGKYRVERRLGKGGMGVVLSARHVLLDKPVAIKLLLADLVDEPDIVERFMREARAAAKIKNPHVVQVTDVDRLESGIPYMVMEYLEGMDLSAVLAQRRTLGVRESIEYVLQACDAMSDAHALSIWHRDLKPANLFLTRGRDGAALVKILDFGISKRVVPGERELTETAAAIGTPSYMSPEQTISSRSVDGRSDIWSLGCILYKLLTGAAPFRGDAMTPVAHAVLYADAEPPSALRPELSPVLDAIILRCLQKLPERRYQTVGDLFAALDAHLDELPNPTATPTPSSGPVPKAHSVPFPPQVISAPPPPPVAAAPRPEPTLVDHTITNTSGGFTPRPISRHGGGRPLARKAAFGVLGGASLLAAIAFGLSRGEESQPPGETTIVVPADDAAILELPPPDAGLDAQSEIVIVDAGAADAERPDDAGRPTGTIRPDAGRGTGGPGPVRPRDGGPPPVPDAGKKEPACYPFCTRTP